MPRRRVRTVPGSVLLRISAMVLGVSLTGMRGIYGRTRKSAIVALTSDAHCQLPTLHGQRVLDRASLHAHRPTRRSFETTKASGGVGWGCVRRGRRRNVIKSRLRSALSPIVDVRRP